MLYIQAALIICGLFICDFAYMRLENGIFSGTYPLIYSNPWSFYIQIHYMRAYLWSTYLSYLTRSTCTSEIITDSVLKSSKSPCDTLSHPAPLERHVLINGSLYSSSTVVVQIT